MAFTPRTVAYDDEQPPPDSKVGGAETFLNRAVNMIPMGRPAVDTLSTAVMQGAKALGVGESGVKLTPQAQEELDAMGAERQPDETIPGVVDTYRDMRDTRAQRTEAGSRQNPWAGRTGALTGFGLSLLAPGPKGSGLKGNVATGAGYGALAGLTDGKADLTRGEFGQALEETLGGAIMGGAAGAAGHGLMELGKRGVQALRSARGDVLAQETLAAREAAEQGQKALAKEVGAHRKMEGQAREMMGKDFAQRERVHGQALEFDKAKAARAAREEGRAQRVLERARRGNEPSPDPNTVVLEGMAGKAHQAQQTRSDKALEYRRGMGEPDLATQVASSRQDYIDRMPEALSDPAAARRIYMEKYLRQRFPEDPERVARIMRERVGPGGEVLPRPSAPSVADDVASAADDMAPGPSLADEAEAAMAARRGEVAPGSAAIPAQAGARPIDAPWVPARRAQPSPLLTPRPVRTGASPAFDVGGQPPPGFTQAKTKGGPAAALPENSMVAPVDAPLPPEPVTRATNVPDLRRPVPLPPPAAPPVEAATANLRRPAPTPASPAQPQEVTRLATPDDMAPLAAERAAAREAGAFGAVARAGYEGVRSGNSVLGAMFGGLAGIRREALKDPAVKARVLAAAKVHLLAQISPEVFAKLGGQMAQAALGGSGQYNAIRYVHARRDPAFREAEEKASEQASRMSDEQLMDLLAGGAPQ